MPRRVILRAYKVQWLTYLFALLSFTICYGQNPVVTENSNTGNDITEWGVPNFRETLINGFSTEISVNKGTAVKFKINVSGGGTFSMKIYRLGYYAGLGARLQADLGSFTGVQQPSGVSDATTGLLDCGNWSQSAQWTVPTTAVSGVYIAKIVRLAGGSNHIVFIVRDDASTSKIIYQHSDATYQAYNGYGGNYLYQGTTAFPNGHAVKVSYNRPIFPYNAGFLTDGRQSDWYMSAEYPLIRWLERNGYDVTYTSEVEVSRNGGLLLNHKAYVAIGHDEYWSKEQRDNVEAARNAGVHLAFFSGNEVYWKTRWESDPSGSDHHVMVCYKEGLLGNGTSGEGACGTKCDVSSPMWTGLWRTGGAYDAGRPENALTGQISWSETGGDMQVPFFYKNLRFWRNTPVVATLTSGQTATLAPNTLGYEWDFEQYPDTYQKGRITMSNTQINGLTHKLSLYRYPNANKALVFGAGTVQWSWGLDGSHFGGTSTISKDMQQATVNLFADMGVQPATMQLDLVAATISTDITAPATTITSPVNGANIARGSTVTISGTAADAGGGVVAGVEISVDGGTTWQVATSSGCNGSITWTYQWIASTVGDFNIKARGFDDSGNMETAGAGITVHITASACPCSVFLPSDGPTQTTPSNDNTLGGIEVGMKFRADQNGYIQGIRYYKVAGTTGIHTALMYNKSTGVELARATFTETASGWQQVMFANSVAITAGTTYIAAYHTTSGDFAQNDLGFTSNVVRSPLTGLADGVDGNNGVYAYSATPTFPTLFSNKTNYWVDVVFNFAALPVHFTNFTASTKGADVQLDWTTASEQKNKGFEIQRSVDGSNWSSIGFVNGAGTNQASANYQYIDKNLTYGKYFYRLNQLDLDGRSQLSKIITISLRDRLQLDLQQNHPNPFNSITLIDIIIPQTGRVKLTLYDQMGRPLQQLMDENKNPGTYQIQVNRRGMSAGIYYYKMEAQGQSLIKKMTIL